VRRWREQPTTSATSPVAATATVIQVTSPTPWRNGVCSIATYSSTGPTRQADLRHQREQRDRDDPAYIAAVPAEPGS
jgi:hypothetical protein